MEAGWEEEPPYLVNVSGIATEATLSLNQVNNIKGWSPDCENATNTNKFDFAVQVTVADPETGVEFTGPWSEAVTVVVYCSPAHSCTIIIVVCVVVALVVVVEVFLMAFRVSRWWLDNKDFFDKLDKELDAKFMLASVDSLEGGRGAAGGPKYELRQFDIRGGGGDDGKKDPGDTDTLLLKGDAPSPSSSPLHQGQPPPHYRQKSANSESTQSDFASSSFGGSSHGCTSSGAANTAECCPGGHLRLAGSDAGGSAASGYISMMGLLDKTI